MFYRHDAAQSPIPALLYWTMTSRPDFHFDTECGMLRQMYRRSKLPEITCHAECDNFDVRAQFVTSSCIYCLISNVSFIN